MLGFFAGITGVMGAICGLLACVAASILMCCGPKSTAEGSCKYTAVRYVPAQCTPKYTTKLGRRNPLTHIPLTD